MPLITADEFYTMTGKDSAVIAREMLEGLLEAASGVAEIKLARKIKLGEYVQQRFIAGRMALLEAYPVERVDKVTVDGREIADWKLDAANGILRLPWHIEGLLEVTYTGGMEHVPMAVKQACALIALSLNSAMENEGQTLMSERLGDYQMMYYQPGAKGQSMSVSPAADALLTPYKNRRVAG